MTARDPALAAASAEAVQTLVRALQVAIPEHEARQRVYGLVLAYGDAVRAVTRDTWRCSRCLDVPTLSTEGE